VPLCDVHWFFHSVCPLVWPAFSLHTWSFPFYDSYISQPSALKALPIESNCQLCDTSSQYLCCDSSYGYELQNWRDIVFTFSESKYFRRACFLVFTCTSLCFDIFNLVLKLFSFSALALPHQHLISKHCLQILGLRMCRVTKNRIPIAKSSKCRFCGEYSVLQSLYIFTNLAHWYHTWQRK